MVIKMFDGGSLIDAGGKTSVFWDKWLLDDEKM